MLDPECIIFDLDGTLLDTITDLACSTNFALRATGFAPHPVEAYKYFVGNGINKLFERALPEDSRTPANVARVREAFLPYYDTHNIDFTAPYDGIPELLHALRSSGLQIAVASNKYDRATKKLIARFFPDINFAAVIGQREGVPVKPDPAIIFEILRVAETTPDKSLYVGDSGIDMQTAANSGIVSIGVTWGFRPREELQAANAVHIVDSPDRILEIISSIKREVN
jgi:phosphoglycolate phosphatase